MTDPFTDPAERPTLTVLELNRTARSLLEDGIAKVRVDGEISNMARPASGHVYFSLKDEAAQIRCAWFRQRQRGPTIGFANGDRVLALGKVSIYEARGDYQLIVEALEGAGEGELRRRFEVLKKQLADEGMFAAERKRALPGLPRRIGIVTSPSGAAVRDVISVLRRRFPAIPVVVYPCAVQGEAAAAEIVAAIETAARRAECDVLIVGRGGGSLEDLWPFNEEIVARAISGCPIPVISAVGHETDVTIADFVADVRAPTPSGAAELAVPDQAEWQRHLERAAAQIAALGRRYLDTRSQSLDYLSRRLVRSSPAATVARQRAWLANLLQVMTASLRHDLATRRDGIAALQLRLARRSPAIQVQQALARLGNARQRLQGAGRAVIGNRDARLRIAARGLDAVSPLATLERGYAIVTRASDGRIVTDAAQVEAGAGIRARLQTGTLEATVVGKASDDGTG